MASDTSAFSFGAIRFVGRMISSTVWIPIILLLQQRTIALETVVKMKNEIKRKYA